MKWNFDSEYICIWGSLKKRFVYIAFVLFTLLPWKPMRTGVSLCWLSYTSFKIHHKIFNSSKLVNFLLSEGGPSIAHSKKINFIGRECSNFEGDRLKYRDIVGNMSIFSKPPPIFLIFLWLVIHFIAVIYCILNLTNSFREDW